MAENASPQTGSTVSVLQRTLQETHAWLQELARHPEFDNEDQAYSALRAALHSLRDRLTIDEASDLAAQLPMLIRGFYYEGWKPALAPDRERTADDFVASVEESLRNAALAIDPEAATRAVFAFLETKLDRGQVDQVKGQLPKEIQALWPTPAPSLQ